MNINAFKTSIDNKLLELNKNELYYIVQEIQKLLFPTNIHNIIHNIMIFDSNSLKPIEPICFYGIIKIINDFFYDERNELINYLFCKSLQLFKS